MQQAKNYAQLLDVPFAFSTNGKGIVEDDRDTGHRDATTCVAFPSPDELWARYRDWKGIGDDSVADGLLLPFNRALRNSDGTVKEPRYYQRTAINRAVEAILSGDKRLLLTHGDRHGQDVRVDADRLEALEERLAAGPQPARPLPGRPEHPHRPADRA